MRLFPFFFTIFFLVTIVCCQPLGRATAAPVFVDDFNDGNINEWQVTKVTSSSWQVSNGVLVGKVTSASSITELIPKPEFWYPGWGDYRFSVDMMPISGADRNLGWNYQDPKNWYEAHFVGNLVELYRLREGQTGYVSGHQFFLTPQVWHRMVVEVQGVSMKLWVDGWLVADVVDWYTDGRHGSIALKVGTGAVAPTEVRFDNVSVELLPDINNTATEVEGLKQTDNRWAAHIYDHADRWSPQPTVERWGCALTSIVMVMRKYGFTQFVDGTEINPDTLNHWLTTQTDGYIAEGWVNWLAVTRLTRQLVNQKYLGMKALKISTWWPVVGQPTLMVKLVSELGAGRPVIVSIPNHFLVADGVFGGGQDIQVKDPWYSVRTLGQHILAGRPPLSLRLVEPVEVQAAGTNGWLLAIENGLTPALLDETGTQISDWQVVDGPERGQFADSGSPLNHWQVWWIPKKTAGLYHLKVQRDPAVDSTHELKVMWYEYLEGDEVLSRSFATLEQQFDQQFLALEEGIQWLNERGLGWTWVELAQWWQQQSAALVEASSGITDERTISAWLRIRYLLKTGPQINRDDDDRYRGLLQKTAHYYQTQVDSPLLQELLLRLPLTGSP